MLIGVMLAMPKMRASAVTTAAPPTAKVEERGESTLGLMGIKERVALVGGRARIISSPGEGTRVEVGLPLHFAQNARR